jgi:putative zinc finger/helix-turn-helix YgiT family protein
MPDPTTITAYCEHCNDDRDFRRESRRETHTIRGEQITADLPCLVCPVCGETQPDQSPGCDGMAILYAAYRAKRNMLTPTEIKAIREEYGLSREAFAAVLGMSPASLYRYEGGALQDETHDNLLRACQNSAMMEYMVSLRRDHLSALQMQRFEEALARVRVQQAAERLPVLWAASLASSLAETDEKQVGAVERIRAASRCFQDQLGPASASHLPHLLFLMELASRKKHDQPFADPDVVMQFGSGKTCYMVAFKCAITSHGTGEPELPSFRDLLVEHRRPDRLWGETRDVLSDRQTEFVNHLTRLLQGQSEERISHWTREWIAHRLVRQWRPLTGVFNYTCTIVNPMHGMMNCPPAPRRLDPAASVQI